MTDAEKRTLLQSAKPLAENGIISAATMEWLRTIKCGDGVQEQEKLVSRKQGAVILGTSTKSLKNYEEAGKLHGLRIAGKRLVRYRLDNLMSLLETAKA
ncbi:MAG: hypothetical protein WCT39_03660 [Candidatus Margulisiibacteriota bacterium]